MSESRPHKYYCVRCKQFLFGVSLTELAIGVNYHSVAYHPGDFNQWTAEGLPHSKQYEYQDGPLPEYLKPYGVVSKKPVTITKEDRQMLQKAGIKWD